MPINRRQVLKYGLTGTLVLAAGGATLALQPTKLVVPPGELKCLSVQEYSILFAMAEILLPPTEPFPAASELQIAFVVDGVLAKAHPGVQSEMKQVLGLIENAATGTLFDGNPRPFSRSPKSTQHKIVERWRTSNLHVRRTAFKAVAGLCNGAYYASKESYQLVGYPGPPEHLLAIVSALQEKE